MRSVGMKLQSHSELETIVIPALTYLRRVVQPHQYKLDYCATTRLTTVLLLYYCRTDLSWHGTTKKCKECYGYSTQSPREQFSGSKASQMSGFPKLNKPTPDHTMNPIYYRKG